MKTGLNFSFIILSILFQSASGIIGKYATLSLSSNPSLIEILTNIFYILGLLCLVLQAIVWQQALRFFSLSFAYPFMGLVNFFVLLYSAVFFHEGVTFFNIAGLIFILFGILVLSQEMENAS